MRKPILHVSSMYGRDNGYLSFWISSYFED
jgi:exonuclease I